jgi:hypothetical protein
MPMRCATGMVWRASAGADRFPDTKDRTQAPSWDFLPTIPRRPFIAPTRFEQMFVGSLNPLGGSTHRRYRLQPWRRPKKKL